MKNKRLLTLIGSVCLILVLMALLVPACAKEAAPPVPSAAEEALRAEVAEVEEEAAALEKELAEAEAALKKKLAEAEAVAGVAEEALRAEIAKAEEAAVALEKELTETETALKKKLAEAEAAAAPIVLEKVTWRHQCAYDTADKEYIALTNFFDAITLATGGMFDIESFPGETIVPTEELLSATAEGVVEVCHAAGGYWKGVVPVANIEQGLPGQYTGTLEEWHELQYDYGLEDIYREAYAKAGVFHLGGHSYNGYPSIFSTVPIRTLSDYEGIIVRVSGAPGKVFEALGASVTWLPGAELYLALKLGTIDIACWSCEGLIGYKWYEICKYVIMPPMSTHSTSHFLINQDAWDALPEEWQVIYETAYHDIYIPQLYDHYLAEWDKIYSMAEPLGYEIIDLSDADVAEMTRIAMEEIWVEEAAKAPECKEALDIVKAYYGLE